MNKVILIGNLGKDPEVTTTQNGNKIAKFSIATDESYKDKQGNKVQQSEWHNCVSFGKQAEVIEKYFTKGMKVMIEGKLKTDKWEDKDKNVRYSTNIILQTFEFLGKPQESSNNQTSQPQEEYQTSGNLGEPHDLPF